MKTLKIAFLLAISCQLCQAQSILLIKATQQNYAGGVAGHYGVNYRIEILTMSPNVNPDTLWINGHTYPLDFRPKEGNTTRSYDSIKQQALYTITVGEAHNEFKRPPNAANISDTIVQNTKLIRQFDGAAMVSYRIKHNKERFFIIKSLSMLPQINYP